MGAVPSNHRLAEPQMERGAGMSEQPSEWGSNVFGDQRSEFIRNIVEEVWAHGFSQETCCALLEKFAHEIEDDARREGRREMREEAADAALGHDSDRQVSDPVAMGYIQGRRDAASDIRALPDEPEAGR